MKKNRWMNSWATTLTGQRAGERRYEAAKRMLFELDLAGHLPIHEIAFLPMSEDALIAMHSRLLPKPEPRLAP